MKTLALRRSRCGRTSRRCVRVASKGRRCSRTGGRKAAAAAKPRAGPDHRRPHALGCNRKLGGDEPVGEPGQIPRCLARHREPQRESSLGLLRACRFGCGAFPAGAGRAFVLPFLDTGRSPDHSVVRAQASNAIMRQLPRTYLSGADWVVSTVYRSYRMPIRSGGGVLRSGGTDGVRSVRLDSLVRGPANSCSVAADGRDGDRPPVAASPYRCRSRPVSALGSPSHVGRRTWPVLTSGSHDRERSRPSLSDVV